MQSTRVSVDALLAALADAVNTDTEVLAVAHELTPEQARDSCAAALARDEPSGSSSSPDRPSPFFPLDATPMSRCVNTQGASSPPIWLHFMQDFPNTASPGAVLLAGRGAPARALPNTASPAAAGTRAPAATAAKALSVDKHGESSPAAPSRHDVQSVMQGVWPACTFLLFVASALHMH